MTSNSPSAPSASSAPRRVLDVASWNLLHTPPRLLGPPPPLVEDGPLLPGSEVRVRARVVTVRPLFMRGRGMGVEATLERADGYALKARFFNAAWLRRRLIPGEWYGWEGRTDAARSGWLIHPAFIHLAAGPGTPLPPEPAVRVAYAPPKGTSEDAYSRQVAHALEAHLAEVRDPLGLVDDATWGRTLLALHRPASLADHETARRRFAQRELAALAWTMQARRGAITGQAGRAWSWSDEVHRRALARLPFALTPGQERALAGIRADLRAPTPMYRLLQGDVGSGKTAVALIAALAVVADGAQVLVLAPTAVLAAQHDAFFRRCLAGSRVRLGLLTGGTADGERARLLADLAGHRVDLLVGTHALLEDDVRAADLGLVVIDEQHKFGVAQRAALAGKGARREDVVIQPDLLLMTATPIPRTLALTVFGDLAVSRIDDRPPGRPPVATVLRPYAGPASLDEPVRATLDGGGRAFVICALREDGDERVADATAVHRALVARFGADAVGLLHGRLTESRKHAIMAAFAGGPLRVLVTTTVVEVGIDVPDATLLAVLDAERFGLAQLHQLRGRIGRGRMPGQCILFRAAGSPPPERLRILAESDDGLAIAEADLAARGPGALLGTDQHGALRLRVADLTRDLDLLQDAHHLVRERLAAGEAMPADLARFVPGDGGLLAGG